MTIINIEEFEGYDVEEFIEFVSAENTGNFVISVPKETALFYSSNEEIAQEYAIAAYIGQKLHEIATKFEYSKPNINGTGEFMYRIITFDFDTLGEFLAEISSALGNAETVEPINFACEVECFMEESKNLPGICKDLFDIAIQYGPS